MVSLPNSNIKVLRVKKVCCQSEPVKDRHFVCIHDATTRTLWFDKLRVKARYDSNRQTEDAMCFYYMCKLKLFFHLLKIIFERLCESDNILFR
jgi:hypothetical protein